jgi:hypothetical protein
MAPADRGVPASTQLPSAASWIARPVGGPVEGAGGGRRARHLSTAIPHRLACAGRGRPGAAGRFGLRIWIWRIVPYRRRRASLDTRRQLDEPPTVDHRHIDDAGPGTSPATPRTRPPPSPRSASRSSLLPFKGVMGGVVLSGADRSNRSSLASPAPDGIAASARPGLRPDPVLGLPLAGRRVGRSP